MQAAYVGRGGEEERPSKEKHGRGVRNASEGGCEAGEVIAEQRKQRVRLWGGIQTMTIEVVDQSGYRMRWIGAEVKMFRAGDWVHISHNNRVVAFYYRPISILTVPEGQEGSLELEAAHGIRRE